VLLRSLTAGSCRNAAAPRPRHHGRREHAARPQLRLQGIHRRSTFGVAGVGMGLRPGGCRRLPLCAGHITKPFVLGQVSDPRRAVPSSADTHWTVRHQDAARDQPHFARLVAEWWWSCSSIVLLFLCETRRPQVIGFGHLLTGSRPPMTPGAAGQPSAVAAPVRASPIAAWARRVPATRARTMPTRAIQGWSVA
jgi:hypothetical protein